MEPMEYEGSLEQFLCEKATLDLVPINGIFELTPLCNMNCEMCFVRLDSQEVKEKGRLRSAEEWISVAEQMKQAGTLFVLLTGGEPLIYPEFKKVYIALKKMGMIITVNTNGTLINEAWADFFAEYPPRRINITLYGKDEQTYDRLCHYEGGFEKTLRGITLLQERGIDLKINGSITTDNVSDLEELYNLVKEKDLVWKFDTYMYPAERERTQSFDPDSRLSPEKAAAARVELMEKQSGKEHFISYAKQFVKHSMLEKGEAVPMPLKCRAGRSSFVINWEGMMQPCVMIPVMKESVFEMGFQKAWEKITKAVTEIRLSERCAACTKREVCQTCAACAFLETGNFAGVPKYMCRYTEETIKILREKIETSENNTNVSRGFDTDY